MCSKSRGYPTINCRGDGDNGDVGGSGNMDCGHGACPWDAHCDDEYWPNRGSNGVKLPCS